MFSKIPAKKPATSEQATQSENNNLANPHLSNAFSAGAGFRAYKKTMTELQLRVSRRQLKTDIKRLRSKIEHDGDLAHQWRSSVVNKGKISDEEFGLVVSNQDAFLGTLRDVLKIKESELESVVEKI